MSLMTIALVCALIAGGIYAFYSNLESSAGNSFTAGSLDLVVDSENPWTSVKITASGMVPGDNGVVDCTLENIGSIAGALTADITNLVDDQGAMFEPECVDEGGTYAGGACVGNTPGNLSDVIDMDIWVDDGAGGGTANNGVQDGTEQLLFSGTLAGAAAAGPWSITGGLGAGGTTYIGISYSIDNAAGNEIMDDSSTFTIEFNLTQV